MPRGRVGGQTGNRNTDFPNRNSAIGAWGLQETNDALRRSSWPTVLAPQVTGFHVSGQPSDANASCTAIAQFSASVHRIGSQRWEDPVGGEWQRATQNADTPRTGNIWLNQNDTGSVVGPFPSPWLSEIATLATYSTSVNGDRDFERVLLLLDGSGTTDKSLNNVDVGYGLKITAEKKRFGSTSLYTTGVSRYAFNPHSSFAMDDFTIELWVNGATQADYLNEVLGALGSTNNFDIPGQWAIRVRWAYSNEVVFTIRDDWSHTEVRTFFNVMDNNWHHIAVVRQNGDITIFIDGVSRGTGYSTQQTLATEPIVVGGNGGIIGNHGYYTGYIDDLRITRNVARYPANFATPTTSFLTAAATDPHAANVVLLLGFEALNNSTTIVDSSPTPKTGALIGAGATINLTEKKYGASSFEFDGVSDTLVVNDFEKLKLGTTDDFTIEAWIYLRSARQSACIITERYVSPGISFAVGISGFGNTEISGQRLFFGTHWGGWQPVWSTVDVPLNTWTHVAVTRVARTGRVFLFIGGQLAGTSVPTTTAGLDNPARNFYIGRRWDDSSTERFFDGYIDELRITAGVARYVTDFFPPAASFPTNTTVVQDPNFSSVALLLPMSTNFNDRSTNSATITNTNAQITTTTTHGTMSGEAGYFNGSAAYLTLNSAPRFSFSGDFTIEGWFKFSTASIGYQGLVSAYATSDASAWLLTLESNNRVYFYATDSVGSWPIGIDSGFTPTVNAWHHIAVVRLNGTVSIYVDGLLRASQASSITINSGNTVEVGGYPYFPGSVRRPFSGWMHQLRITNNVARYGTAFTPPAAEFPSQKSLDPFFDDVKLVVNFDTGIEDMSNYKCGGLTSNSASLSTTINRYGRYSLTNGNVGYAGDFALSGSFTIEGWFYFSAVSGRRYLLSTGTLSYGLVDIYLENGCLHYQNNGFEPQYLAGDQHVTVGAWNHIALVRDTSAAANIINCFINGAFYGSFTHSGVFGDTAVARSFFVYAAADDYVDSFRVTTAARYSIAAPPQINNQFQLRTTRYHIRVNGAGDLRVNGDYYPFVAPNNAYNRKQFYRKADGTNFTLVWSDGNWIIHPSDGSGNLNGSWQYYSDGYNWVPIQKVERQFVQPLSPQYVVNTPTFLDNNTFYRFKADSGFQTIYSSVARLTLEPLVIVFSKQPGTGTNEGVVVSGSTTFSVTATGVGRLTGITYSALTYQWQKRSATGTTWTDINGGNGTSLTVSGVSANDNGERYRVRVGCGALNVNFSNEAVLTVQ